MERCWKCRKAFLKAGGPDSKLKCDFCGNFFHGGCQDVTNPEVVNYISSGRSTIWSCTQCQHKREYMLQFVKNISELQEISSEQGKCLKTLSSQMNKISDELKLMRQQLNGGRPNASTPTVKRSFAALVGTEKAVFSPVIKKVKTNNGPMQKKRDNGKVIVIKHIFGEDCSSEIENTLKKELNPLKDPVFGMRKTSKNKVVIHCKDESAFVTYKERISAKLGEDFVVDKPRERKYVLKFVDTPKEIEKEQLLTCIGEQNNCSDLIQHLSVRRIADNITYIECDNEDTYKLLLSKKKVFVLWNVVRIQPYVNLRRCYCCQQFGHTSIECDISTNDRACPKCAGMHEIAKCVSDVVCCINCLRENNSTGSTNPTDHFAWSGKCPVVIKELAKLEAKNKA